MAKGLWTPDHHIHTCLLNIPFQIDAMSTLIHFTFNLLRLHLVSSVLCFSVDKGQLFFWRWRRHSHSLLGLYSGGECSMDNELLTLLYLLAAFAQLHSACIMLLATYSEGKLSFQWSTIGVDNLFPVHNSTYIASVCEWSHDVHFRWFSMDGDYFWYTVKVLPWTEKVFNTVPRLKRINVDVVPLSYPLLLQ